MSHLDSELQRLMQQLVRCNAPEASLLRPGLSRETIAQALEGFPLSLPEDIYTLYQWCNGINPRSSSDAELLPGYSLYSLEEALEDYHEVQAGMAAQVSDGFDLSSFWDTRWFPILADFSCGYYGILGEPVVPGKAKKPKDSRVYSLFLEDGDLFWEYDSLTSMVATIATCYEAGAYRTGEDGFIETTPLEVARIGRELNPQRTAAALEALKVGTIEELVELLEREDGELRGKAMEALLLLADEAAVDALISTLKHDDEWVRYSAVRVLGELKASAAGDSLVPLLQDPDPQVRWTTCGALGRMRASQAIDALIEALNTDSPKLQRIAAGALGEIGDPRAIEPLLRAQNDESHHVREAAEQALAVIRDRATREKEEET